MFASHRTRSRSAIVANAERDKIVRCNLTKKTRINTDRCRAQRNAMLHQQIPKTTTTLDLQTERTEAAKKRKEKTEARVSSPHGMFHSKRLLDESTHCTPRRLIASEKLAGNWDAMIGDCVTTRLAIVRTKNRKQQTTQRRR